MKLNIALTEDRFISGYSNVLLEKLPSEHQSIINNSCTEILVANILDLIDEKNIDGFINLLISKLRLGGTLFISCINLDIVARNIVNGTLSEQEFNQMIQNIKSIHSRKYMFDLLSGKNLKIQSSTTKGNIYEIIATR
ncbi:hypothetical protein EB118_00500 [bacterium]|nr:hypothetical protein [bacterium]